MEIAVADEIQVQPDDHTGAVRAGMVLRKWLLMGEGEDGLRFRLFESKYQKGEDAFESPRHHHAFQQIRWTASGSVNYAPDQDIPEGSLAYFPKGTFYGPQRKDQGVGLLIQFGFGDELPVSKFELQARHELASTQRDGEVMAAERPRAKVEIPAGRYDAPILIHPPAFEYHQAAPGVEIKNLGGFYDHAGPNSDTRISVIRLSENGLYQLSEDRAQLGWSASDGLKIAERSYPRMTSFYSPRGEAAEIRGVEGVEVYVMDFPRRD